MIAKQLPGDEPAPTQQRVGDMDFRVRRSEPPFSGHDPDVVLVHGLGMSHRSHARLHAALAESRTVLSIDLPGFGGVPTPDHDVTIAEMADALGALLDRSGVRRAVLVGQSMGAQWVLELALQRPELVDRVVMIGPVVDDRHQSLPAQMVALGADSLRETPRINALVTTDYWRCGIAWYLQQARHMLRYRTIDRVRELGAPLLIIRGSRDRVAGLAWCRRLRSAAPQASLVMIPGGTHHAQFWSGRGVAAAIRHFAETA